MTYSLLDCFDTPNAGLASPKVVPMFLELHLSRCAWETSWGFYAYYKVHIWQNMLKPSSCLEKLLKAQFMSGPFFGSPIPVWKIPFKAQIIYDPSSQSPVHVWPIILVPSKVVNHSKAHVPPIKLSSKHFINLLQVSSTFVVLENLVTSHQYLPKLVSGGKIKIKNIKPILHT